MNVPDIWLVGGGIGVALLLLYVVAVKRRLRAAEQQAARDREAARNELLGEQRARYEAADERDHLKRLKADLEGKNRELDRLLKEKSKAMPWLAEAIADLHWMQDERHAEHLRTKRHPALAAADAVKEHAREKRELRREKRLTEYRVALYEGMFPWLADLHFADAEKAAEAAVTEVSDRDDPASAWLSRDEWITLPSAERYQRALDRYTKRSKTDWEIGREFERFVGYHWEADGYDVVYHGAIKGFEDFGRDLIITGKTGKVALIQCKYWARHKTIPEAAIFQLLGTTVSYYVEKTGHAPQDLQTLFQCVQPYLYTSAKLDRRIKDIATAMGIRVKEEMAMKEWPMIKCNVSASSERIYHLPLDQQYDRVKISKSGEFYAWTVAEAEAKGFRRAKRWYGAAA